MPLEVIGVGFGRTGTRSLQAALQKLGYDPCLHYMNLRRSDVFKWHDIAFKGKRDWEAVYGRYKSAVDTPTYCYYKELYEAYPDAKFILTVRSSPEKWYESSVNTVFALRDAAPKWVLALFPAVRKLVQFTDKLVYEGVFNWRYHDPALAKQKYLDHNAAVKATIPPEKLLVMEVSEGWEPLCAFLGKPVPDEPFPRRNDAKAYQRMVRIAKFLKILPWIVAAIGVAVAITIAAT
ncbi:sulfotransferase family protein [Acuticoccus kandeliae]|uniref:sulfotransferase family protein n=1 Tax=Acuticoccus kandeliae TaxID=2073160 RepID=UPI001300A2F2|nr:sulfotransferase family protein [Acuticoccus kandeliae]